MTRIYQSSSSIFLFTFVLWTSFPSFWTHTLSTHSVKLGKIRHPTLTSSSYLLLLNFPSLSFPSISFFSAWGIQAVVIREMADSLLHHHRFTDFLPACGWVTRHQISMHRPPTVPSTSTNSSAITGSCSSHTRRIIRQCVPPSWALLPSWSPNLPNGASNSSDCRPIPSKVMEAGSRISMKSPAVVWNFPSLATNSGKLHYSTICSTSKMPPTWTRKVSLSPSAPSLLSIPRRKFVSSCPIRLRPAVIQPKFSAWSIHCKREIAIVSPHPSTGSRVTMWSSIQASRMTRPKTCFPILRSSSRTCGLPPCPKRTRVPRDACCAMVIHHITHAGRDFLGSFDFAFGWLWAALSGGGKVCSRLPFSGMNQLDMRKRRSW